MRYHQLKRKLHKIKDKIKTQTPTYLTNEDFTEGTYIINTSGYYKLQENIVFNPNADKDYFPAADQSQYQTPGFVLGFFAAIAIAAENVYLDLNGYSIKASKEFALQQRFFSLIELGDSPFVLNQGPADFGSEFIGSKNVVIANGELGLSSHHGIHGNFGKNILLQNLNIKHFEVAAISLNGSENVLFNKIEVGPSRTDVPVLSTYSAARFARFFGKNLLDRNILPYEYQNQLVVALGKLEQQMNIAYDEIITSGKTNVSLFNNKSGLPDGTVFGVLAHSKGIAVNDFDKPELGSEKVKNIFLNRVKTDQLQSDVKEVIGLSGPNGVGCQVDVAGAVFRIDSVCDGNTIYRADVLSDMQLLLAEISIKLNIPLGKTNITLDTIEWAKSKQPISMLLDKGYKYKCSGDSMFHVSKQSIGYRFGGIDNLLIRKCKVKHIENHGRLGNDVLDGHYTTSHDAQTLLGYHGNGVVGYNIAYCSSVNIYKSYGHKLFSHNGNSIGINVMNNSEVIVEKTCLDEIWAGTRIDCEWIGEDYYGNETEYNNDLPNKIPCAIGINSDTTSKIKLRHVHIKNLKGPCKKPVNR